MQTVDKKLNSYKRFVESKFNNIQKKTSINSILFGLAEESGEVLGYFKKKIYHKRKSMTREKLIEELGDLFYYFTALLINQGISFDEIIKYNQDKLNARYPDGFSYKAAEERLDEKKHN